MLIFTQNLILTIYCILSIAGIVCGVLAVTKWKGWYLGVMESINCTIVVGFSVDYVIHLAHTYTKCQKETRVEKMQFSLTHMGISVLGFIFCFEIIYFRRGTNNIRSRNVPSFCVIIIFLKNGGIINEYYCLFTFMVINIFFSLSNDNWAC